MDNKYGGVIWTNHALQRLRQRNIKQGDAWATWRNPEQSRKGASGNWVYYRTYGNEKIEVVAKQNEKREWLILSVWSDRVYVKPAYGKPEHQNNRNTKPTSFLSFLFNILFKK